jgi:hypothetical protein
MHSFFFPRLRTRIDARFEAYPSHVLEHDYDPYEYHVEMMVKNWKKKKYFIIAPAIKGRCLAERLNPQLAPRLSGLQR